MKALRAGGRVRGVPNLAAGSSVLLADVSEFQPEVADAAYVAWSPAIIVRAAYGDAHDDKAWYGGQRRQFLHDAGIRFLGIYQYLVAGQDGGAQADALADLVGDLWPGEVLIADFEQGEKAMLTAWYNRLIARGYPHEYLWTYTGLFFGESQGVLPVEWIADYTSVEPASPHKLWQFTAGYAVPGVGTADCSLFHGSIDELAALAYPATPPGDWVFSAVRDLALVGAGPRSVKLSWDAPGTPEPLGVGHYEVTVRLNGEDVPKYPRTVTKGTNPQVWQGGGLQPGTQYEALVRAVAAGPDGHASPWASLTFTTAAAAQKAAADREQA